MDSFTACFVCSKDGNIVYANEEFENNINHLPNNTIDDISFLIECVREKFEFEGLIPLDVCAIIDNNTSDVIWKDGDK